MGGLSIRAFAKLMRVTHKAVQKAIKSGRLVKSVRRNDRGHAVIDQKLGKQEWRENARKVPNSGGGEPTVPAAGPETLSQTISLDPAPSQARTDPTRTTIETAEPTTLTEAQMRYTIERTTGEELKNQQRRGELLDANAVYREGFECARLVRDNVMNIPDRISAELAAESNAAKIHTRLSEELREALDSLSEALAAEAPAAEALDV